jgi:hypothetical protein
MRKLRLYTDGSPSCQRIEEELRLRGIEHIRIPESSVWRQLPALELPRLTLVGGFDIRFYFLNP